MSLPHLPPEMRPRIIYFVLVKLQEDVISSQSIMQFPYQCNYSVEDF